MKNKFSLLLLALVLLVVLLAPRLVDLGTYATADEPQYLRLGASFYYLLSEGRFSETDLIVHPGVTSLWSGAAGFYLVFPEYIDAPLVSFPIADRFFWSTLRQADFSENTLLAASRAVSAAAICALLAAGFLFARQVFGFWPALLSTLLIGFDPFFFANSRLLQPDAFLSAGMYLAVIAFLAYLFPAENEHGWQIPPWVSLLVSAAAAALSVLSKVPGVFVFGLAAVLLAARWWFAPTEKRRTWAALRPRLRDGLIWLAVAVLLVFALWPVMWTAPGEALAKLWHFTAEASSEVNSPMFFNGQIIPEGEFGAEYWYYYPLSFLWRTTPVVLLGLLLGLAAMFIKRRTRPNAASRWGTFTFLFSALAMVVFFTLSAKKFDRYILPAFVFIDVVAALGFTAFFSRLKGRIVKEKLYQGVLALVVFLAVLAQAGFTWQARPYYHAYYNPLMGGLAQAQDVMMVGWGEGLDQAAHYLNERAKEEGPLEVYSWYSPVLEMVYDQRAEGLPISAPIDDVLFDQILESDYVVTYLAQRQRGSSQRVLDYLADKQPVYVVEIDGVEFAWVYKMGD